MGAGLSGLACALTLQQQGLQPTIYEKRSCVGDRFVNCEIMLSLLSHPVRNQLAYLEKNHDISLSPADKIERLIIHSPNHRAIIRGELGITNLRGRAPASFERQLARQLDCPPIFDSSYSYHRLKQEFDCLVLATGDAAYARKLNNFNADLSVTLRGGIIRGQFDTRTVRAWLNNRLAPGGYGYLIPLSEREANLVIGYPEYPDNIPDNQEQLWNNFLKEVASTLQQSLDLTNHFEVNQYLIGLCQQPRVGNTYFVGNNFGAIMPFLGFGQFSSILTGIHAAREICGREDYKQLVSPLRKSYYDSLCLRRVIEKLNNNKLDLLVKGLSGKLGSGLFNSRYSYLKLAARLLRPFVRLF